MAYYSSKKDNDGYYSNAYSDGRYSAKEGKTNADEWYELDPEKLASIAGGAGQGFEPYDTYRFWRDSNGVLREIR